MSHSHLCPSCQHPMDCHAPTVTDDDGVRECILVMEDDLGLCDDCEADRPHMEAFDAMIALEADIRRDDA